MCALELYLLVGHFALQCKLLLSGAGCVNGRTILSSMVILLPHTCRNTRTHTHIQRENKEPPKTSLRNTICMLFFWFLQ